MSSLRLGYRIVCDGCGQRFDRDSEGNAPGSFQDPFDSANGCRQQAHRHGWITTGLRRIDGTWPVFDSATRRGQSAALDACPDCRASWTPPYSQGAIAEMAYRERTELSREVSVAEMLARLVAENADLRRRVGEQP